MKNVKDIYKPPFTYDRLSGFIYDAEDNHVADKADGSSEHGAVRVRGWGRISYMENPEEIQDSIGEHIARALTEYWNKNEMV